MQKDFRDFNNIKLNTSLPINERLLFLENERLLEYNYNPELKELEITKELIQKIIQLRKIKKTANQYYI